MTQREDEKPRTDERCADEDMFVILSEEQIAALNKDDDADDYAHDPADDYVDGDVDGDSGPPAAGDTPQLLNPPVSETKHPPEKAAPEATRHRPAAAAAPRADQTRGMARSEVDFSDVVAEVEARVSGAQPRPERETPPDPHPPRPAAAVAPRADQTHGPAPSEIDFSDVVADAEANDVWGTQAQPRRETPSSPRPRPARRHAPPANRPASPAGGRFEARRVSQIEEELEEELEGELDERLQNELFPWARRMGFPWLSGAIVLLALTLLGVLLVIGRSYYELPVTRRALHHLHDTLRPSGTVGLLLGIAGLGVMLLSLLYLVRKQLASWARFGSLQGWLGFHIFTGFLGPGLILFHAAFMPYSAIGVLAYMSMLTIVVSGVVGRYVYVYCPTTLEGRELEVEDVRQRLVVYRNKLAQIGIDPSLLRIDEPATGTTGRVPWLIEAITRVIWGDRESKREYAKLSAAIAQREDLRQQMSRLLVLARRLSKERQWVVRYNELRKIMGAWRFFHRWLAIVMLAAVAYHIVVTVAFGDLWILGGRH